MVGVDVGVAVGVGSGVGVGVNVGVLEGTAVGVGAVVWVGEDSVVVGDAMGLGVQAVMTNNIIKDKENLIIFNQPPFFG